MQELTRQHWGGTGSRNCAACLLPLLLLLLLLQLLLPASLVICAQQLARLLHSLPVGSSRQKAGTHQTMHAAAPERPGAADRRCRCIFLSHQCCSRLAGGSAQAQPWQRGGGLGKKRGI